MDLNRATILGRVTRDPEVRSTTSGQSVCTLSVATNRAWTDSTGTKQEKSEFHNCVLWGKLADIAGQYVTKGRRIYLEGRIETRDWTDQAGVKKYRTELVIENMIMLDGPRGGETSSSGSGHSSPVNNPNPPAIEEEIKVEDIPF
ncbi:MAG: single-stranded DNA-binding protein [Candidatus Pacebacteria bacterium]|nr:single-stranded DNA-binding protein [Candidatus Paceibacterota bacterium]